jgi:predicted transcriptional regulator
MLKEIIAERRDIATQEAELMKRKGDLEKLETGLKTLIEVAIETSGDERAKAHYDRICRVASSGGDPSAKINKTHLMLDILKKDGAQGLNVTAIQERLSALGVEVDRNYIHTVLNKLRSSRGLLAKEGDLFVLTEKGRELPLKVQVA